MASRPRRAVSSIRPWHIGVVAIVVGAVLLTIGLVRTTAAKLPAECAPGSVLVAKFEYQNGTYVFETGTAGAVTITNGSATGGDWTSTVPISAVIVKGGPGASVVNYSPPVTSGHFSNSGLPPVGAGNTPDISNVQFCGPSEQPTTTSSTTTTAPTTTTSPVTVTTGAVTTTAPTTTAPTTTAPTTVTTGAVTTTAPTTGATTTTAPTTSTSEAAATTATTTIGGPGAKLPRTGSPSIPLVVIGSLLLAVGLALIGLSWFRMRRVRA